MKSETPQILWHNGKDNDQNKNAPIYSISLLQSGIVDIGIATTTSAGGGGAAAAAAAAANASATTTSNNTKPPTTNASTTMTTTTTTTTTTIPQFGLVMATAGNHQVNLWKLFVLNHENDDERKGEEDEGKGKQPKDPSTTAASSSSLLYSKLDRVHFSRMVRVDLLTTLVRRHDGATVNTVQFSPNGLHLATASDSGCIVMYSIPPTKRGGGNGHHYWSLVENESQLSVKILSGHYDGIYDLSWSHDSKRFTVGTLDHCVAIYEDESYDGNHSQNHNHITAASTVESSTASQQPPQVEDVLQKESQWKCVYRNARDHTHYVQGVAMDPQGTYVASMSCDRTVRVYANQNKATAAKKNVLELGKGKLIKYRSESTTTTTTPSSSSSSEAIQSSEGDNNNNSTTSTTLTKTKRISLFAEEAASESFFRRLSWTPDGAYLITPAALWKGHMATLMFRRHCYDAPYKVLLGHDKPSRVVVPNPVLFHLPTSQSIRDSTTSKTSNTTTTPVAVVSRDGLPYKSVFCVLLEKTILVYDTYHTKPIFMARGLHYSGLTHAAWAPDGHLLIVSSSDGYLSFFAFNEGELGQVYQEQKMNVTASSCSADMVVPSTTTTAAAVQTMTKSTSSRFVSPTCRNNKGGGKAMSINTTAAIIGQKRFSEQDETTTASSTVPATNTATTTTPEPVIHVLQPRKKKKRAQLTTIAS